MPILSSLEKHETISISNNQATFKDLEPNIRVNSANFDYSPQDIIGQSKEIYVNLDNELKFIVEVGVEHNVYKLVYRWS